MPNIDELNELIAKSIETDKDNVTLFETNERGKAIGILYSIDVPKDKREEWNLVYRNKKDGHTITLMKQQTIGSVFGRMTLIPSDIIWCNINDAWNNPSYGFKYA